MSPSLTLNGRIALVTGAGRGLGRASALSLAKAGADLALVARSESDLQQVARQIEEIGRRVIIVAADMTQSRSVETMVDQVAMAFGSIDILVHSVGRSMRKQILDYSDSEWRDMISTNLDSLFFVCRSVGRRMKIQNRGTIINISSAAGLRGRPNNAAYSSTKAAVINFSKAMALELAPNNIRVNILAPGRFLTSLTEKEMSDPKKYEDFIQNVPLRRIGQPQELEEIITWMASDASGFMTGSTIVIDGGQTLL